MLFPATDILLSTVASLDHFKQIPETLRLPTLIVALSSHCPYHGLCVYFERYSDGISNIFDPTSMHKKAECICVSIDSFYFFFSLMLAHVPTCSTHMHKSHRHDIMFKQPLPAAVFWGAQGLTGASVWFVSLSHGDREPLQVYLGSSGHDFDTWILDCSVCCAFPYGLFSHLIHTPTEMTE